MTKPSEETINALIQKDITYMRGDIGEIKQTLKDQALLAATKAELTELEKRVDSNAESIKSIQKFQWIAMGGLAILSFLAPIILSSFNLIAK